MDALLGVIATRVVVKPALTQAKFCTRLSKYRRYLQGDICRVFSPALFLTSADNLLFFARTPSESTWHKPALQKASRERSIRIASLSAFKGIMYDSFYSKTA
jgi:hypothetical protein